MKSAILKKLNTALPSGVKRLFGPYIRRQLFENKVFKSQLAELSQINEADSTVVIQMTKLKDTLIHAYEHTRYYKQKFDEYGFDVYHFSDIKEMEKIPLMTRTDITANFIDLQADDIMDYYESMTGGSSGASLKILLDKDSIYRERAFIYYFWGKFGYDYRSSRIASFRGGIDFRGKFHKYNPLYNEIQLNPCVINGETIGKYLSLINKFKADFIHGLPSAIFSFCKYAMGTGLSLQGKYKAVFFISENVYDYQREFIEEALGCKAYAYYGHTERAVFAEQAEGEGGYNFNGYYCYAEVGENEGSIVTTGFINRKMPLIRYELDDSASWIKDGNENSYEIIGHRDGILYGKNGELISAASLYIHDATMDKVAKLQFIQAEAGKIRMLVCPIDEITERERRRIEGYYQEKLGSAVTIEVEVTEEMVFTGRGKMPLVIQRVAL